MEKQAIYESMVKIMKAVEPIKKEKTNTQGAGFKYRGIDDVLNSLHNAFADAGVFITTDVISRDLVERVSKSGGALFYSTLMVKYTFHALDGSTVSSTVVGTAMDSGDKADNKSLSISLKYCLLQLFLIPTDEMKDPDAETHEVAAKPKPEPKPVKSTITDGAIAKAVDRIKAGELTLFDNIWQRYELTEKQKAALSDAMPKKKEHSEMEFDELLKQ